MMIIKVFTTLLGILLCFVCFEMVLLLQNLFHLNVRIKIQDVCCCQLDLFKVNLLHKILHLKSRKSCNKSLVIPLFHGFD